MIRLQHRVEGGGSPPPRVPGEATETPRPSEAPPSSRTEGSPETRRPEDRHSTASTRLAGAGSDLAAVTGTSGTTTPLAPPADPRERFRRDLERFESIRRSSPDEARRMLPSLRRLAGEIRDHLRSTLSGMSEDLRMLRRFYRGAVDFLGAHGPSRALIGGDSEGTIAAFDRQIGEYRGDLRTVEETIGRFRTWLRGTLVVPARGRATPDQIANARILVDLSRDAALRECADRYDPAMAEIGLAREEHAGDLRTLGNLLYSVPESVMDERTQADQMTALLRDWGALRRARPSGGREDEIRATMRDLAGEIGARAHFLSAEGSSRHVEELLNRYIDANEPELNSHLSASGLEAYTRGMAEADQAFRRASAIEDLPTRRTAMLDALGRYSRFHNMTSVRRVLEAMEATFTASTPDTERIQVYTAMMRVAEEASFSDAASSIRVSGRAVADRMITGDLAALTGSRVSDTGLGERVGRLLLARSFFAASGSESRVRDIDAALRVARDRIRAIVRGPNAPTDPRARVELAGNLVQINQALMPGDLTAIATRDYSTGTTEDVIVGIVSRITFGATDLGTAEHAARMRASDRSILRDEAMIDLYAWQTALVSAPISGEGALTPEFELEQSAAMLRVATSLRMVSDGADHPLFDRAVLDGFTNSIEGTVEPLLRSAVRDVVRENPNAAEFSEAMTYDLRTALHFAVGYGDTPPNATFLSHLSLPGLRDFAEHSMMAHALIPAPHEGPLTAEDLEDRMGAAQIFSQMGLENRVRDTLRPVEEFARGLTAPEDIARRGNLLLTLAQMYQGAGMTTESNARFREIVSMDGPNASAEVHTLARLAQGLIELNEGHQEAAMRVLLEIPDHPTARLLLDTLRNGSEAARRGRIEAIDRVITSLPPETDTRLYANIGAFRDRMTVESLSDADFAYAVFELASGMRAYNRYNEAAQLYGLLAQDPAHRDRAREFINMLPTEAIVRGNIDMLWSMAAVSTGPGGALALMGTSSGCSVEELALALIPFGVGSALGRGAEAAYVFRARSLIRSASALEYSGIAVRSTVEAAGIALTTGVLLSAFSGFRVSPFQHFGREFLAMLVTMAVCHGIGTGVQRLGGAARRSEALTVAGEGGTRTLRPWVNRGLRIAGWGSTIVGLTGVGYFNEAVGLHESQGDIPFLARLFNSAVMDAQMRLAARGIDRITGGRINRMEENTRSLYAVHELLPAVERLGYGRPDARGRISPEGEAVLQTLMARVARGESAAEVAASVTRRTEADLSRTVRTIFDVDPASAEGRRFQALLFAYSEGRGSDFALGSRRLSEEVGRIRMETARSLRALGLREGPEFSRLRDALLERMLNIRVRGESSGTPRPLTVEEVADLTERTGEVRGPLEGVVREVIGTRGLRSREGQALLGDLYVWMLETGRPVSEARAEAIRRLVAEATRPADSEPLPSASGAGLTGTLEGMVRGSSAQLRQMGLDFGLGESIFAGHSVMERAVRPLLESLFNNPDSPPTMARIRAHFGEVRSLLEAANARITETIPAESQAALREEIFVEVLNGRMSRERALERISEVAPERSGVRNRPGGEGEAPPLAARDGSLDLGGSRRPGAPPVAEPPPIPESFSTSDGTHYAVSASDVSSAALNLGEIALRGPTDLANSHSERSTPETRRRLAAAMAFARAQGIPRSERRFILTEDNQVLLEINRGGTRRRVRLTEEVPDLTAHVRAEPPEIADLTEHAVPEPNIEGVGRLEDGALHVDFAGLHSGEVRVNDQTLIFRRMGERVLAFNFTSQPLRVRHADGSTSEPVPAARGPRGREAVVPPGVTELRAGDVILLADGTELPYGGATIADTLRRATSVVPEGRSEEGTRRLRRPGSGNAPSESGTRRLRGPRREAAPPEETAPRDPLVDGRLQLDFRDRVYQTVSIDGATLTGRRGEAIQLYNFTGAEIRIRHADGSLSEPIAPPVARTGELPLPPGSAEVRPGDVIVLANGREIPVGESLVPRRERATVRPPGREPPPVVSLEGRRRSRVPPPEGTPEALPLAAEEVVESSSRPPRSATGVGEPPRRTSDRPPPPPERGAPRETTGVGEPPVPSEPEVARPELFGLESGDAPRFLGYNVSRNLQEGLFRLITPTEETPFVNFAEEGLRVSLEGRNARREVPGFTDFGHIVDRHSHASTNRGPQRAGIYGENVDIEVIGRETIRGWDQVSTSYDGEGRRVFTLRRTYDHPIGVDTDGNSTRVNQVVLTWDGRIVSSYPVPAEGRGFVARGGITSVDSFNSQMLRAGERPAISNRHAPFLPGSPSADRSHLYLSSVPFGMVNLRTLAAYQESLLPANAGVPTTAREGRAYDVGDGTTVINSGGTRGRVLVAEMRFEEPLGVRETVRPDGTVEETPLYWNRTYYAERMVRGRDGTERLVREPLGGYPISDPSEPHLADTVWNEHARPRTEVPAEARVGGGRRDRREGARREAPPRGRERAPEPPRAPRVSEAERLLAGEGVVPGTALPSRSDEPRIGAPSSAPVLASSERRADLARVIRAEIADQPAGSSERRAMEADLAAVEAGTADPEILARYAFQVVAAGERISPRESRYLSFDLNASRSERVTVREVSEDGRSVTVESADGRRVTFQGVFPGPHAFRVGDSLSLITLPAIAGGAGGRELGTMAFASPSPGVYTCTIGRGASGTEGYFAIADSPHSGTISRRHAEVRIEGGRGYLSDLGGANGTRVWDPPSRTWRRLAPGERYPLQAGEGFQLGGMVFMIERGGDGNYRLRLHGEGRDITAAPFSPRVAPIAGGETPGVLPPRVEPVGREPPPSSLSTPLDFSRGSVVLGSFRGREVPAGGVRIADRRVSREHVVLNPGAGGELVIEARPDTRPPVLRGENEVTPIWVRQGEGWVMLGSAEHPSRSHALRPGESFALGTHPNPTDRRGRRDPDADPPLIFTVGPDGRRLSSVSEFTDRSAPVREPSPERGVGVIRQRVLPVGEEAPPPEAPPSPIVQETPRPERPAVRFGASSLETGMMLPAVIVGDPIAELASLPAGTEVFVASRGGRLVVERSSTPESLVALRMDGRGAYRVRSASGAREPLALMHTPEGGAARTEPLVGHTGAVLRPGQNVIAAGSHFLSFHVSSAEGAPRGTGSPAPAPLPATGSIGRGHWSVSLPDAPRGSTRTGLRLNDLAESTGFLDLYAGDPASSPRAAEPGIAQLTLADPLGGTGERRSLGRLERTAEGWVIHAPRSRGITLSRPNPSRPNDPPREISLTREGRGTRLRDGDRVDFGGALEFEFRNGSLIPAITGDLNGRLVVPELSRAAAGEGLDLPGPRLDSLPPSPFAGTGVNPPVIRDAYGREMTVPLTEPGMLVIGRAGDLRIGGDVGSPVSGRHTTMRLVIEEGAMVYQVRDGAEIPTGWQPSLNGSFVNGERIGPGEWRTVREGDRIRLGTTEFTWHPPRSEGPPIGHQTIDFAQWQQMNPEILQTRQFLASSYLDGAPADRLEIPGRSAVYMEGAGRFVEGAESGGREIIVWDRSRDTEVTAFLGTVEGEVRTRLGISRLDPASPTFERDLGRALDYFVGRLRETYRVPGESARTAQARLDAFTRVHAGDRVLVGDILHERAPFCRHLTLLTQAFLTDLGLRGETVRMQRGYAPGGAHVWNEVIVGGTRRIVEPTWAFYSDRPGTAVLMPAGTEAIYQRETRAGRVER